MEFIETDIFARRIEKLLTFDEFKSFQAMLAVNPKSGDVIPGCGGIRKVRWRARGRGKSGGICVVYYYVDARNRVYLLLAYAKSEMSDLSQDTKKTLKQLAKGFEQ